MNPNLDTEAPKHGEAAVHAQNVATSDEPRRAGAGNPLRTVLFVMAGMGILVSLALLSGNLGDTSDDAGANESGSDNDSAAAAAGTNAAIADGIYDLPFLTVDGTTATLANYRGEPLVLNFFASWCPPCRAELPDFEATHQELGDRVTFVGINQDFTEETWRAFVAESAISYDTVFQPDSEIWTEVGTQAMPTTVFIDADGEVQQVWAGLITDDKLTEVINETLLEPAS